jgi:hypothetical protein
MMPDNMMHEDAYCLGCDDLASNCKCKRIDRDEPAAATGPASNPQPDNEGDEMSFRRLTKKAIAANRARHKPIASPHEGLALLLEEVTELQTEVFRREHKGKHRLLNELTQIAAICEIMAEDL